MNALAGGTQTFEQSTRDAFSEGEALGTVIEPTGRIVPGMTAVRVPIEAGFAWSGATSPDGKTAWFGTGDEGRIYAITITSGNAKPRLLATLPEPWVTAIVALSNDTLLAATTPGGKIYRVDAKTGKHTLSVTVGAGHVWALVHDPERRITFAATGQDGKVFAIEGFDTQSPRLFWDSGDAHVVSLALGAPGTLLAGTAEEGILYAIGSDKKVRVVQDFEANEVRAVLWVKGVIYVAANEFSGAAPSAPAAPLGKTSGTKVQVVSGAKSPLSAGDLPRPSGLKAKGAIYRIEADGSIEQLHALSEGYFTALTLGAGGEVLAASGSDGKLFRVSAEREVSVVADLPERQVLSVVATAGGLLAGTGDLGAVFSLVPAPPNEAIYLSKVFDATRNARWGQFVYGGPRVVQVETRSGNTARPDANWEDWKPLGNPRFDGSEEIGTGEIASAPGRYFQYRVRLATGAALRSVVAHYLPQNLRARVTELYVENDKKSNESGKRRSHSDVLKLRWKVENPDDDVLSYKLSYRQPGEPGWRPLGPEEPLTKAEFDWDTESVPDGRYEIRIWTSDIAEVSQDRALSHEYVAPALLVDNGKPAVDGLTDKASVVIGRAADLASNITHVEVSIDGGPWRLATPEDGLFDERQETFSFKLPTLLPGTHVITVRAYDARDNVGTGKLLVRVK